MHMKFVDIRIQRIGESVGFTPTPNARIHATMVEGSGSVNSDQRWLRRFGVGGGFTLIELIISVAVFSIIMIGVMSLLSNIFTVNRQQGALLSDQDQARRLSFTIMNEIRNATVSNTGAYPLEVTAAQTLVFYSNIDADADIERVRYFLQNGGLYKGVKQPNGSPLSYATSPEVITQVQANVGSNPTLFRYFDDTYDGVTGVVLEQPVSVTAVRFVALDLSLTKRAGIVNTGTYTVSAQAAIRSLKTNLGAGAPPPAQAPVVDMLVNASQGPVTLAYNGSASLTWTSTNTSSCVASGSWAGNVGVTGSQSTGALISSQTYTLQCTGPGGTASDSVTVTVQPPPAPTVNILANGSEGPITITYNTAITLTWTSTTATDCTASGSWSGAQATNGSWTSGALTSAQTYTLQCTGPGGTASDSVTVNVTAPPPPQPSCVSAAPQSTNANGNGTFYVYAYGVNNATQVEFYVYKGASELLISGVNQGGGTWRGSINLAQIPSKGWYTVDVLLTNAGYADVLCATTQFRRR
ncbi:MAG: prepilin-type N-terminal cleavage/methylation domain-containing protein [Candidatus Doudnabacteria bacterium]|nr:prepilin-type N-terminal cleavage/methylation domain-containing protein [Candidatus Doudnabacteria bacterium]